MAKYLITQIRHFIIDAESDGEAADTFSDAFVAYEEVDFEIEESGDFTVVSMETVH